MGSMEGKRVVLNEAMPVVGGDGLYNDRKIKFHLTQMPVAAFI